MTSDLIFRIGSQIALIRWLALVFAGRFQFVPRVLCKLLIPGFIAVLYSLLIVTRWAGHPGGYGSLEAVRQLFTNPWILTAAWLHYLAFDLFCGAWQVREAQRLGIGHLVGCAMSGGYVSFRSHGLPSVSLATNRPRA